MIILECCELVCLKDLPIVNFLYVISLPIQTIELQISFFIFNFWFSFLFCLADIIFLIYIYQRWVYPVDKKRVNEFGFSAEADQVTDQVIEQVTDGTEDTAVKPEEKKTNWADV